MPAGPRWGDRDQRVAWIEAAAELGWCDAEDVQHAPWMPSVLPNAWLGVSVETQRWARVRLPELARTLAAVRFASCEPLLSELDLKPWLGFGLDWVIAGGESGPGARPMHPRWARMLRDQCVAADVPYFFKQWGAHLPVPVEDDPGFAGGRSFANPRTGGRSAATIRGRGGENRGLRPMQTGDRNGLGLMLDDTPSPSEWARSRRAGSWTGGRGMSSRLQPAPDRRGRERRDRSCPQGFPLTDT